MKVEYKDITDIVETLTFKYAIVEDTTTTTCKAVLPNSFTVNEGETIYLDSNGFNLERFNLKPQNITVSGFTDKPLLLKNLLSMLTRKA